MRKRVLWGHQFSEYQAMFDLSDSVRSKKILEYGSGASAINATLHQDTHIISLDPLFGLPEVELKKAVQETFDARIQEVEAFPEQFNVSEYGGMSAFFDQRRAGLALFFEDYAQGHAEHRYQPLSAHGPLPFEDFEFDLTLSSHYLFAGFLADETRFDSDINFHMKTLLEMARVSREIRVFPLIERAGEPSSLLGPVLLGLQQANLGVEVKEVACALYPQGNAMLRIWAKSCRV